MSDLYHHNALPPGSTVDEYRLIEVLGEGGFGIVYRGEGRYLGDQVAIKEYLPRHLATRTEGTTVAPTSSDSEEAYSWGLKKFQEEARILWNLAQPERHPNIVAVRRFFEANGTTYMVMDFEEARPLSQLLKGNATLPQKRLEAALFSLLNGLKRVHDAGVWHRDIKPANILIRADGSPVLLDFGAARQTLDQQTRSVVAAITPPYAAFEQYAARGNDGPWTDIYALGVTLFRCITGKLPPEAAERADEDSLVPLSEQDLPGYSPAFLAAVDKALAIRAKDRPQSVDEWRGHFEGLGDAAADALESGGDTTVLRAPSPVNPPSSARPEDAESGERSSATLLGERERLTASGQGETSSNKRMALFGAVIALVVAGAVGATLIDMNQFFADPDSDAWQTAFQAGDASAVSDYLQRFPDGAHVGEARTLLAEFEQERKAAEAAGAAETAENEAAKREAAQAETSRAEEAARAQRDAAQAARDLEAWEQAANADNIEGYRDYLKVFPEGTRRDDARVRISALTARAEELARAEAQAEAETQATERAKADQARQAAAEAEARADAAEEAETRRQAALAAEQAKEQLSWAAAETNNSIEAYEAYLATYSDGANASTARDRIAALTQQAILAAGQADEQAWKEAGNAGNVAAYRDYLESFPNGNHADSARARLEKLLTPVVTETAGRYAALRNANVRGAPSRDGIILGSLKTGSEVRVTARVAVAGETWLRIDRGGKEAFVYGTLLREMPREEIIAWNELRIVLDETFGERVSPADKIKAISAFLDSHPNSHHVPEAEAEREAYREQQAGLDAQAAAQASAARLAWSRMENSDDPAAYRAYLRDYPQSEFAPRAQASLDKLVAAAAAEQAAKAKAEAERLETARRQEEAQKQQEAAAKQNAADQSGTTQSTALAFPEPSISRDDMQAFFEDNEYVLRAIITDYNRKNRIHVRGAAADPRAAKIFSLSVRSALPPSVGDGRYADVNFAIKDGRNEVFRPFRFGILWNDGEPEIISHSRLR